MDLFQGGAARVRLAGLRPFALGFLLVVASMALLFLVPQEDFAAATLASTTCMMAAAYAAGGLRLGRPNPRGLTVGLVSAAVLYAIFLLGGWVVSAYHPLGITSASESSIYSLISSPSNPLYLQFALLLFDSAGYESFFRGVLQAKLAPRLGAGAAPAVALLDASIHVLTLNPLWVGAPFVTATLWGLSYHYGRGTQASFTSHLAWDLAIFILWPIR